MLIQIAGRYVNPNHVVSVWAKPGEIVKKWYPAVELVTHTVLLSEGQDRVDIADAVVEAIVNRVNRATAPVMSAAELVAEHRGDIDYLRDKSAVSP